jgi:hypothetical protein
VNDFLFALSVDILAALRSAETEDVMLEEEIKKERGENEFLEHEGKQDEELDDVFTDPALDASDDDEDEDEDEANPYLAESAQDVDEEELREEMTAADAKCAAEEDEIDDAEEL